MKTIIGLIIFSFFAVNEGHAAFSLDTIVTDASCDIFSKAVTEWGGAQGVMGYMACRAAGEKYIPQPFSAKSLEQTTDVRSLSPLPGGNSAYVLRGQVDIASLCSHFNKMGGYLTPYERAVFFYLLSLTVVDESHYSNQLTDKWITSRAAQGSIRFDMPFILSNYTLNALQQPGKYGWTVIKNELLGRSIEDIEGLKSLLRQYDSVFRRSKFEVCIP